MFRITQDPSRGSTDSHLIKITRNSSTVFVVCAVGIGGIFKTCGVFAQYESILPDDGSCVARNMLE
jgi:hypothetical protein